MTTIDWVSWSIKLMEEPLRELSDVARPPRHTSTKCTPKSPARSPNEWVYISRILDSFLLYDHVHARPPHFDRSTPMTTVLTEFHLPMSFMYHSPFNSKDPPAQSQEKRNTPQHSSSRRRTCPSCADSYPAFNCRSGWKFERD